MPGKAVLPAPSAATPGSAGCAQLSRTRVRSQLDCAHQEQDKENYQDKPDNAAAAGKCSVAPAVAVAAAEQDENQDHDKDQYDGTHASLLGKKDEHPPDVRSRSWKLFLECRVCPGQTRYHAGRISTGRGAWQSPGPVLQPVDPLAEPGAADACRWNAKLGGTKPHLAYGAQIDGTPCVPKVVLILHGQPAQLETPFNEATKRVRLE
jgi:hypothetical protein